MRRRVWEAVKTALIVLLLCSLVLMSMALLSELVTGRSLPRRLGEALGWIEQELPYTQTGETYPAAATPLAISMTGEMGRGSTVGDPARTAQLYESLSRQLGEALATASMPVAMEQTLWQELLCGESVSFLYPGQIPLESLSRWLGALPAEGLSGLSAEHLTLCVDGEQVSLLLPRGEDRLCLSTAVSTEYLRQALEECRPDGSFFALEDEALARVDPLSLVTLRTALPQAVSENPLADGDRINAAATLLGLNPYRDTAYTGADGTVSFTSGTGRLRVTTGGVLTWQAVLDGTEQSVGIGTTAIVDAARQLLAELADSGDASLQLNRVSRDGQTVTVRFDYVLGGYPVWQSEGSAAELVYVNGVLRELRWTARRYTLTGETATLLPARQAAAIVSEGARLQPVYMDSGSGLVCGWPA